MSAFFALSWKRSPAQARLLGKPPGRAVSNYPSQSKGDVESAAAHINSIDPEMDCRTERFT